MTLATANGRPADLADCLRRAAQGDEQAFADLYDVSAPRVHGLALAILRMPGPAEQVAREAYLEVWRTAARFDPARSTPLAWIVSIVHRLAVDRLRRDPAHASQEAAGPASGLVSLDQAQRRAVELTYLDGLTRDQAAAVIGASPQTVDARLRAGLARLGPGTASETDPGAPVALRRPGELGEFPLDHPESSSDALTG